MCHATQGKRLARLSVAALVAALILPAMSPAWAATPAQAAPVHAKKAVKSAADLPAFSYKVPEPLDALLTSDAAWAPFAAQMRANLEGVLRDYAIADRKTQQQIELDLLQLDLDANRHAAAEARLARALALEDKPETRAFDAQMFLFAVVLQARRASGASTGAAYHAALAKAYAARLATLPDAVSANVARVRGIYELASPDLARTVLNGQYAPVAKRAGHTLDSQNASDVLWMRSLHRQLLPTRPELLPAFAAHLAAHPPVVADIWAARDVALDANAPLTPVTVAVWDSGVDTALFPGRMYVNSKEQDNGRDNDGNGYIADVHGIAYDAGFRRSTGNLFPIGEADRAEFPRLIEESRLLRELQAGVDNEATRAFKARVQGWTPAQAANEARLERLFMGYWHGTSVANMAAAGNPAARILSARFMWEPDPVGVPGEVFDEAWAARHADQVRDVVAYFKAHGVRVVNMSWSLTTGEIADNLRRAGVSRDDAELQRLAVARMATMRAALQTAFAGAPGILFVAAAGNSNDDTGFHQALPGSIELPNVLAVGAVDQVGAAASFTSFGRNVGLYAKGVELDALVPGGAHIVGSGTSFAAPQVSNLAAKLLAVNPRLTTAEVVKLIRDGATTGEDKRLILIHPKRSLELLAER